MAHSDASRQRSIRSLMRLACRRVIFETRTLRRLSAPSAAQRDDGRRMPAYDDAPRPDSMPPAPAAARSQRSARTTQAATDRVSPFYRCSQHRRSSERKVITDRTVKAWYHHPLRDWPPTGGSHGKLHPTTKILSHARRRGGVPGPRAAARARATHRRAYDFWPPTIRSPRPDAAFTTRRSRGVCCFYNNAIRYRTLHATIASGRVRLATDGGAKIAR